MNDTSIPSRKDDRILEKPGVAEGSNFKVYISIPADDRTPKHETMRVTEGYYFTNNSKLMVL
jgi:hypothetical protein